MVKSKSRNLFFVLLVLIGLTFVFCYPAPSTAAGPVRVKLETTAAETLTLTMGKSLILESPEAIRRVALAQPAVADAMVLSPRQIYLTAKAPGMTSLTLWGTGDAISRVFDVEVVPDVNRLKEKLHTMFPNEKNISVSASHDYLTLSGSVSNATALAQVVELASAFAPAAKEGQSRLINLLEVGGVQQVMLEVRVSEMSRSLSRRLGFNFAFLSASGQQFGLSLLSNLVRLPTEGWPGSSLVATDNISGILRFLADGASWTVFIDALKDNGLLKVLAEPTLIALSGKEAKFLAGGEFPIPVPQASGGGTTITIEYKPFGVGLTFTPIVLSNGKISMQVAPEVSELDFSSAVSLQGYVIPSISTRRVATTVELADGQSFAIAGLLAEQTREVIRKFPVLGDVPVLGALFRSSAYQKRDSELIVIVTPHLVKPVDLAKQTIPTDQFVEPNDVEFYLLGAMEGKGQPAQSGGSVQPAGQSGSKLEGKFGHITPK
jgi:pilus assembly protein CpaC